jgi:excinuclease ABC subunit C
MVKRFLFNQKDIYQTPTSSGCYLYKDQNNKIIYVGKAVNLKNRLISYLSTGVIGKTKSLVENIKYVSLIQTDNEIESLILESLLIKKYQPKYNILLKDDKSYLYIKITNEKYPRVITDRKTDNKIKYKYVYGPFPSTSQVRYLLKIIRKIFPYSTHKPGKKGCLDSQIGLCDPCPSNIERINSSRKKAQLTKTYQDNIRGLVKILSGKIKKVRLDIVKNIDRYSKTEDYESALKERQKLEAYDYITQKKSNVEEFLKNPNFLSDIKNAQLKSLASFLKTSHDLKEIECFDVAHISGKYTTASVVRFTNGFANKKYYRNLKIQSKKVSNDIASMKEVALRRKKHLSDWGKPDLMLIDGGVAQVNVFKSVFKNQDLIIIGYEKRSDHLVYQKQNNQYQRLKLKNQEYEYLVKQLIAEAHRFARRYHHHLIKNTNFPELI